MLLLCWLNKGNKRSSESLASLNEAAETPHYKLYLLLSTLTASGPLTLAVACTSEFSVLNFIALLPDGVAVFCVV